MTKGTARLNDRTDGTCYSHSPALDTGGTIITASSDTFVNGRGVARLGDLVKADCGHTSSITSASGDTYANGKQVARDGDSVGAGPYIATIKSFSGDTDTN